VYVDGVRKVYEVGPDFARAFSRLDKTMWDDITKYIECYCEFFKSNNKRFDYIFSSC
jgi:hydrogenase maturation factor HypF (carbamoyltransferase family)